MAIFLHPGSRGWELEPGIVGILSQTVDNVVKLAYFYRRNISPHLIMTSMLEKITTRQLIAAGCVLTFFYALFSQGVYHYDEHFQILEYAHMKLFGVPTPEHLAWEYLLQMRPGLQPLVAWAVGHALLAVGLYSPFVLVFVLQLLSGVLSVAVFLFFYRTIESELSVVARKWMLILGFFLWCLSYLHVHYNAEMLSGNLLLLLVTLTLRYRKGPRRHEFGWGLLLGLAAGALFAVRFQMGFALLGYGLWLLVFCRRGRLYAGMVPGVVLMLAAGLAADRWLYGAWTFTPWNYLRENILNAHMLKFGADPWWYYLTAVVSEGAVLFGVLLLSAVVWFFWRNPRHLITWTLMPFIAVHFFMAHKELRFLFPVLMFAPFLIVWFVRELPQRVTASRGWVIAVWTLVVINLGATAYCLVQDTPEICFYKMMRSYCAHKPRVVALNLAEEKTFYSYMQRVTEPRVVETRVYMPNNFDNLHFETSEQLEQAARRLATPDCQVLVLAANPDLEMTSGLPLKKIVWKPYPGWVMTYCNFNDWTRFCVRSKNVYEVVFPTEAPALAADAGAAGGV